MTNKSYPHSQNGKPITTALVEELAKTAEDGFDVDEIIHRRGGRPPMGTGTATVESVRLEPELRDALHVRAEQEGRTNSELIREALRRYLQAS